MTSPSSAPSLASRCAAVLVGSLSLVASAQTPPEEILLKDYKPRSIFKIPETRVEKARYAVVDVHSHDYARTDADVDRWVRTMDEVGLEKTITPTLGRATPSFRRFRGSCRDSSNVTRTGFSTAPI